MSELNEKLARSVELAKTGFDNAQERIGAIDTKVGMAVGLLVVLLPAPLIIIGWITGLENSMSHRIFAGCSRVWFLSILAAVLLLAGMICALVAILRGVSCLTPRGPKGYGKCGPFQNEWRPNVLFPLHKPDKVPQFCEHLRELQAGVDLTFVVKEYDHQLQQLGAILDAKFVAMTKCFWWLNRCLVCYGFAILGAACIGVCVVLRGTAP